MIRPAIVLLAALTSSVSIEAQVATLRVTGTVSVNSLTSAPWTGVSIGEAATFEAQFTGPPTVLFPGQWLSYATTPGPFTTTIGSVVDATPQANLSVQNDLGGVDLLSVPQHPLAVGGDQAINLFDMGGAAISSTDLASLVGSYSTSQFTNAVWSVSDGGVGIMTIDIQTIDIFTGSGCAGATATFRNDAGGSNPANFTATAPVQGGTMDLTVTNVPGPYVFTAVATRPQPLDAPTQWGNVLVNIAQGDLLNLAPQAGSVGNWSVPVPTTTSLCGATFSAQGYGFAPGQLVLYNAYDLVVGS